MMLFELSGTSEALEVPSEKPDSWRSQCSEILMQEVSLYYTFVLMGIQ